MVYSKVDKMRNAPFSRERQGAQSDIDWSRGNCKKKDPDTLFVQGAEQNVAKRVCNGCPVRMECLATALDNGEKFGVWGGMTERERRALLRRHPQVTSWRKMFDATARRKRTA